jgi:hypothetical protein
MTLLHIDHERFANFDDKNVFFSPDCKLTLDLAGARTVSVITADCPQRCTAMIGVSGGGYMFLPFINFKGSTGPRGRISRKLGMVHHGELFSEYPLSNLYAVQERAWMNAGDGCGVEQALQG